MRRPVEDDDETLAIERALDGLEDDSDGMRLGDRLPEEHRPKFSITIALGDEDAQGDKYTAPGEEELDEEDEELV